MDKIDAAIARLRTGSLMAERYTGKPMVITYEFANTRVRVRVHANSRSSSFARTATPPFKKRCPSPAG